MQSEGNYLGKKNETKPRSELKEQQVILPWLYKGVGTEQFPCLELTQLSETTATLCAVRGFNYGSCRVNIQGKG